MLALVALCGRCVLRPRTRRFGRFAAKPTPIFLGNKKAGQISPADMVKKAYSRFRNYSGSRVKPLSFRGVRIVGLQISVYVKNLSFNWRSHAWKTLSRGFTPDNSKGESKSPFKGESFRPFFSPHKKGRARRGMSDKVKIIYNLIDVLNCNQH